MTTTTTLVGKASPDLACVYVHDGKTKIQLKKLQTAKKPLVVSFVSMVENAQSSKAASAQMEENHFKAHDRAKFVVCSVDGLANAQKLHSESAIKGCTHVYASSASAFGVKRLPAHAVIAADGKLAFLSEEEGAAYMGKVP